MTRNKITLTGVLTLLLIVSYGVASLAQQGESKQSGQPQQTDKDKQKSTTKTGTSTGQTGSSAGTVASSDSKFVIQVAHGGMMEVELGRLASQKASSDQVKQFAQRMVDDHSKANSELMGLASSKGITLTGAGSSGGATGTSAQDPNRSGSGATMDSKNRAAVDKMSGLSGAEFDREYMRLQVKNHEKTVELLERQASRGTDTEIKAWAAKALPTVQEHLRMARDISAKTGGSSSSSK